MLFLQLQKSGGQLHLQELCHPHRLPHLDLLPHLAIDLLPHLLPQRLFPHLLQRLLAMAVEIPATGEGPTRIRGCLYWYRLLPHLRSPTAHCLFNATPIRAWDHNTVNTSPSTISCPKCPAFRLAGPQRPCHRKGLLRRTTPNHATTHWELPVGASAPQGGGAPQPKL